MNIYYLVDSSNLLVSIDKRWFPFIPAVYGDIYSIRFRKGNCYQVIILCSSNEHMSCINYPKYHAKQV